jgi:hypothetical protein
MMMVYIKQLRAVRRLSTLFYRVWVFFRLTYVLFEEPLVVFDAATP